MARIEAVAKLLHYPTPLTVMAEIARVQPVEQDFGVKAILDPCASDGAAVEVLANAWGMRAHGVELDQERAQALSQRIDIGLHGSYAQLEIAEDEKYSVLFMNPPYDYARLDEDTVERQELQFLSHCTQYLVSGGLLVFIPPSSLLGREDFQTYMAHNYTHVSCFRFPDEEFKAFKQVVVFATKVRDRYYYGRSQDLKPIFSIKDMPILGSSVRSTYYLVGSDHDRLNPVMGEVDPASMCPDFDTESGVWGTRQWKLMTQFGTGMENAPLVEPRAGHQAMLLAAGALNGCQVGEYLVKGGSNKKTEVIEGADGSETHKETIVSHLSVLSLQTGEFDTWDVMEHPDKTAEWFNTYKDELAEAIRKSHTPSFDGDYSPWAEQLDALTPPGVLPGKSERCWLEGQKVAACALVHRWNTHKNVILSGEMGVGKTSIATVASSLAAWRKVVVMCPGHLVKKWVREIDTIRGEKCATSAKTIAEVDAFFADPMLRYLVVSKERAKLGAKWAVCSWDHKKVHKMEVFVHPYRSSYGWGGGRVSNEKKTTHYVKAVQACPSCGHPPLELPKRKKVSCDKCGEKLWTYMPISKSTKAKPNGTRRWPLAAHIAHKYARRYSMIVDECHQYAGGTTDQSRAVQKLLSSARKTLMMTGTLYGGRATSIFHLLYKCEPSFRALYEFTEAKRFAEHHGLFERVYSEDESYSRSGYRRGNTGGRIREIPGMSPAMIPMLLPYTVFVKLADFDVELPEYTEELVTLDPDPDVHREASAMAQSCLNVLREYPQALGAYLQACLGYPDRPDQDEVIEAIIRDDDGEEVDRVKVAEAPALPHASCPKDDYVVQLATQERKAGRGVLVYTTQNNRRDVRERLKKRLEAVGLRVVVLDASVAPDKREDWIRKAQSKGFDVLLTNGRLVETGLDLMWAHTILQYGTEYSIHTLRQTLRRSWRLGQDKPIRVFILAQKGTMQETASNLIANKMRAAEMVDGDEAGGLAQVSTTGSNFLVELAQSALMG